MKTNHMKPKNRRHHNNGHRHSSAATLCGDDIAAWPAWFKRMGKKLARVRWLE